MLSPEAVLLLILLVLLHTAPPLQAQPNLNFRNIEIEWPEVELYFTVDCDGQQAFHMTRQDFRLFENGMEVKDFTLWCPDTSVRFTTSVAIVLDASGSMSGTGNAYAKLSARAWIDQMDGAVDEAAIIWFNNTIKIQQQMTTLKPLLYAAVDALPSTGGTALYDAMYAGLFEVINNGLGQARAVIVMTDGQDGSSTRTPEQVINLANRNRIPIYTIGIGTSIDPVVLANIADQTGGRYYQQPQQSVFSDINDELTLDPFGRECIITYERDCADGALRTVELRLEDFCGGSDTKTKTYQALLDSTTFSDMSFDLIDAEALTDSVFTVSMTTPSISAEQLMHPLEFTLRYDAQCLEFLDVTIPAGSPLEGLTVSSGPAPGGVRIATGDRKVISVGGTLMHFRFRALADPDTAVTCMVEAVDGAFEAGCRIPRFDGAQVRILSEQIPPSLTCALTMPEVMLDSASMRLGPLPMPASLQVTNEGTMPSDSVFATIVLPAGLALAGSDAPDRFTKTLYPAMIPGRQQAFAQWTLAYPPAPAAMDYTVRVWTYGRDTDSAMCEAVLSVPALTAPRIAADGDLEFCDGGEVTLDAGPGFAAYRWSTGEDTRRIVVRSSGTYFCEMDYPGGGMAFSDTVTVTVWPPPATPPVERRGDSLVTANASGWQWFRGGQPIAGATRRKHLCAQPGTYTVQITDSNGCTAMSDPFTVDILDVETLPSAVRAFDLYPYPAGDRVTVHLRLRGSHAVRVVLRDLLGRELRRQETLSGTDHFIRLDLHDLGPGVYVVQVQAGATQSARLLVVDR